jgi:FkbM family methyltransferase
VFVDCGAFDGENTAEFVGRSGGVFKKAIAFEPDPASFARLREALSHFPDSVAKRIGICQAAVSGSSGRLRFDATGTASSSAGSGGLEVDAVALDEKLADEVPTYIKMDIEGAEADALRACRRTIANHAPVLAINAEHRQDDIWTLPLLIHSLNLNREYRFFLRPHLLETWDLVIYAIPPRRLRL